jgi:hypothetical protein
MAQRRDLLGLAGAGLAAGLAPAFLRHARAADVPRFALGVASGQPRADGMVLWTRLSGADLPPEVAVRWELAEDEAFTRIAARGVETALAADAHSVHAEPSGLASARWYWYRFAALGQQSMVGRTRTAPAAGDAVARLDFAIASCQRWDVGFYAAWRHAAAEALDLVLFLGDYIYEYAGGASSVRPTDGRLVHTLDDYRARYALHKSDPALQAAHAACPWLLVWDDHEVENDYAGLQGNRLEPDFPARRAAAYRAYWEHMPLPKAARRADGTMRMHGRLDWGRLARVHLLDDRQMRDPQACPRPGYGGSNTVRPQDCPALADPRRTLLGAAQEAWLAGALQLGRPGARRPVLDRRLGRLPRRAPAPAADGGRQARARGRRARRRRAHELRRRSAPGLRRPEVAARRERVLRHLDHEPVAGAVAHRRRARLQPPRQARARRPARLRPLHARRAGAARRAARARRLSRPNQRCEHAGALRRRGRPARVAAGLIPTRDRSTRNDGALAARSALVCEQRRKQRPAQADCSA